MFSFVSNLALRPHVLSRGGDAILWWGLLADCVMSGPLSLSEAACLGGTKYAQRIGSQANIVVR
jgi:hypothetical protein